MNYRDDFICHWLDGSVNQGKGRRAADALTRMGVGNGAIRALDYWEKVQQPTPPESDVA